MKQVRKIMFVMIASLATMSLFSFRSATANEESLKNIQVTSYASTGAVDPGDPINFTGAIIRTVKKVLNADCKALIVRVLTSIILVQENQSASNQIDAKGQALLGRL